MPLAPRPVLPLVPPRRNALESRRQQFARRAAMFVTVVAALAGVFAVAAAAVALAIT